MLRRRGARRGDDGFTLIELIISIAILGLVMVAITGAMAVAMKSNSETGTRLDESRDVQFASTWFGDDVQSANRIAVGGPANCGSDSSAAVVIRFANTDITTVPATPPTTAPDAFSISYVLRAGGKELHRLSCSTSATPDTDVIVARSLSTEAADAPTVGCVPADCSDARTVTLTLTEQAPAPGEPGLTYTLKGTRRSS